MADQDQATFVRASNRSDDPVGRIGDDWGHYDETWSRWHGGHGDEKSAREACAAYARTL